jgi:DNA processing protein
MTAGGHDGGRVGACAICLRRSWLLSLLSGPLEYRCRDRGRLFELLTLGDDDLLRALAGRRRAELEARYARFDPKDVSVMEGVETVCRHGRSYPPGLDVPGGPPMLNVAGGLKRLEELMTPPTVAIVGTSRATDYGIEMAKSLARGLAASGVTVMSGLSEGIAVAVHSGALEVLGGTVAVIGGGLDVACPASQRSLYERVKLRGCGLAELPCGCEARRWGPTAGERILAMLAQLTQVVEARDSPAELAGAGIAKALGRTVAAVPGRVTSPTSSGPHTLLIEGADIVRGPGDVLELLSGSGAQGGRAPREATVELDPRLKVALDRVGEGRDTPEKLTDEGEDPGELLLALSELELMGLLGRGDGGRYVPRNPLHA